MSPRGYWTILGGVVLGGVVLAGCAHTVDIRYPEAEVHRALLASVQARRVTVESVADRRPDPTRIGVDPKDKEPLVSRRPVGDIVHEALVAELQRNGHTIVPDRDDLVLTAEVEDFSLDVVVGRAGTQYVGKVALAIAVDDRRSGRLLFARRYVALKRRTTDGDVRDAVRDVMNAALARTIRDFATDPDLARAFGAIMSEPSSSPACVVRPGREHPARRLSDSATPGQHAGPVLHRASRSARAPAPRRHHRIPARG